MHGAPQMRNLQSKEFGQLRYESCVQNRNTQMLQEKKKKITSTLAVSPSSQECHFPGLVVNMTTNFPSSRIKVSIPAFGNRVVWAQNISKVT